MAAPIDRRTVAVAVTAHTSDVTVTVTPDTSKAAGITDPGKQVDFLTRVLPWPKDEELGFCNLHWRTPSKRDAKKMIRRGRPTRTVDDFRSQMKRLSNVTTATDIYMCMSRQGRCEPDNYGKQKAIRSKADALALKAIWLDVDIKDPPKGYASLEEAIIAITVFVKAARLPPASALIGSGNGLHCYWISKTPLSPDEWPPYAEGLKTAAIQHGLRCDAGVTTDAARVLRVPGTFNYKTNSPRPVRLLYLGNDYDFSADLAQLAVPVAPTITAAVKAANVIPFPFDLSKFPKRPIPPEGIESLAEGLEREELPPLDWGPLVKECAYFRDALKTGGKEHSQPLWHLTILAATFLETGEKLAHKLGNKHPGYTPESTKAMWDRKVRDRQKNKSLGFPQCKTIHESGCTACATCLHFAKGKSPLNFGLPTAQSNRMNFGGQAKESEINSVVGTDGSKWPGGVDDKTKRPRKGILNTIAALGNAGITCTWDDFRQKEYWFGHADKSFDGEVRDAAITVTRRNIERKFNLYPVIMDTRDAVTCACRDNKRNPVLDYFDRLKWDRKPRLDKLAHKYFGADDTPLNAAISRKVMCAIVRRAKKPGCKFDHQWVLQGIQGIKKSMFCEDLAVFPDLYTDAGDLSGSIKDQMDIIQGKQIIEFPELAGYSRASREHNKAMLSRKVDRARLSYAHYATDVPRGSISIATTNEGQYLNGSSGNRVDESNGKCGLNPHGYWVFEVS